MAKVFVRSGSNVEGRFWPKVKVGSADECWEWAASRDPAGYGTFWFVGASERAHRVAWTIAHGTIPAERIVCHHCDNPPCCNPAHLYAGTKADNNRDMVERGRARGAVEQRGDDHWTHRHPDRVRRGENSPAAKLTDREVTDLRGWYEKGWSQTALAYAYEISQPHVSALVRRERRAA